jgi:glycerophosphoryl diester phosphodiesterase
MRRTGERAHSLINSVVVESFALAAIAEIKRLAPEIRTAALFEPKLSRPLPTARRIIERALEVGADEIALHRTLATRRMVSAIERSELKAVVWTVDSPAWARRGVELGVHALITNKPGQMRARLDQLTDS